MAKKHKVSDIQGRIVNPNENRYGSKEELEAEAKRILDEALVEDEETFKTPEVDEASITLDISNIGLAVYDFFRKNIYEPKRVFYPCSATDITPIRGFPNSEVVLLDRDELASKVMKREGIRQFVQGDVKTYNPENPFDLVVILNPSLTSKDLTRHLACKGYVLSNNWHENASQLLEDADFEGIGTIEQNDKGVYLAKGDFSKVNESVDLTYVFRKVRGK